MDLLSIASTFLLIFVAELGDKTQLAVISLSCSYKWSRVFVGALLAFLVVDGVSIAVGGPLLALLPVRYVQIGSGIVFIIFGVVPLLRKKSQDENADATKKSSRYPLLASFSLVALMELGDKTQILTITLAAQISPIPVLIGMALAFILLTAIAVFLGAKIVSRLPQKWLRIGTSVLFIIIGVISIVSGLFNISLL